MILDRENFLCGQDMKCSGWCDRLWNHKGEHRCSGEHDEKEEE